MDALMFLIHTTEKGTQKAMEKAQTTISERVTAIYLAPLDNHEIDMANKKVLDKIKESLVKKEK